MVRVGFIGVGGMGRYQAAAFAKVNGCVVAAGSDVSAESRAEFTKQFPDAKVYEDHGQLLRSGVDAVVLATPTGYHAQLSAQVLRAGLPLLLEKPMARTVAECRRLNDLAEKTGVPLMVAHCRRYDPYWGIWRKAVLAGRIGAPVLWRHVMAGRGPGRWFMDERLGGGPLLDGAVHNYDFANWIFGDPVSVVAGTIKMDPAVTAADTGSAIVQYAGGNQLLVSWSWAVRGLGVHDVLGPRGFIQFGIGKQTVSDEDKAKNAYCCLTDAKGNEKLLAAPKHPDMYVIQARHFLDCVRGRAKCRTPGTEAIKAVAVAEAILKAGHVKGARKVTW
jgi:myo-inositol 2-dehydrogenase/D-chiro-inositol 1-dehydrogenase